MITSGKKLWCDKHWTKFREGMLKGEVSGVTATLQMSERTVGNPRFLKAAGVKDAKDLTPEKASEAIDKIAPACCWMGDAIVDDVYAKSKVA